MNPFLADLRTSLAERRKQIADLHHSGASGFETCVALTALMDETIRAAMESPPLSAGTHVAVFALGGYGRAELSPHSDIDLMILCDAGEHRDLASEAAGSVLHLLWDAGVNVGHSVRTIEEACALYGESLDAWSAMLESRFICGKEELATGFLDAMAEKTATGNHRWFVEGVLADLDRRHQRYGNSVKLLEPNIKKSAGALRDLHTLFWLFRGTDPRFLEGGSLPALRGFLELLLAHGFVEREKEIRDAAQFLLRVRHEMHLQRASLHDTLEYGLQLGVANALGFAAEEGSSAAEIFMRQYYTCARTIDRSTRRLCRRFRETVEPRSVPDSSEFIGAHFVLNGDMLSAREEFRRFDDVSDLFSAFLAVAEHDAELDVRLQGLMEDACGLVNGSTVEHPGVATIFRKILASHNVGYTLRAMNELDILGRFIPEFGDLVAFFQHNIYHYFTADEHTLIAVAKAEALREESGVLHEVFRNVRRKDTLYAAILLHDIAKPRSVADHEVIGVDMASSILTRLGMSDAIPMVSFLIRNHLVMEQVAFRRNIHDPQTIREFASRFSGPEQLDYLYLLTYADLSSVNMTVWTDWKASILRDLYRLTSEVLRRNLKGAEINRLHESRRETAVVGIVDHLSAELPRERIQHHLDGMENDAYISLFSVEEIASHIRAAESKEQVSVHFRQGEGHTEITLVGNDAPFVLSRCCAVLSANDANIFDANIFTRTDGTIIDRFRVTDAATRTELDQRSCAKISDDIRRVLIDEMPVETLFAAHKRKWKRRAGRVANPSTRIDVVFEDNPGFTIIDVYAPDSVGFLYRITETISRLGLDIHFAKIATRIDGVVDAFYVRNKEGQPVADPNHRDQVRSELLRIIREVSEEMLGGETGPR